MPTLPPTFLAPGKAGNNPTSALAFVRGDLTAGSSPPSLFILGDLGDFGQDVKIDASSPTSSAIAESCAGRENEELSAASTANTFTSLVACPEEGCLDEPRGSRRAPSLLGREGLGMGSLSSR